MKNLTFSGPSVGSSGGEGSSKNSRRKKLKWHPAFLQAMQLELFEHKDSLDFRCEYQLTSEPLRIDLLIIKKPKELVIEKNIARIFRTDNIIEYKSPEDYLSVCGDYLPIQIIVSKRLPESENLWLGSLRNNLKAQSLDAIMKNGKKLAEGSTPEFVQKITGLSLDEIEKL